MGLEGVVDSLEAVFILSSETNYLSLSLNCTHVMIYCPFSASSELPVNDSTPPPTGQIEDSTQGAAEFTNKGKSSWDEQRVKYKHADKNQKRKTVDEDKVREKSQWKEGGRKKNDNRGKADWKKGEREPEKFSEEKNKGKKETEQWQKDSARRADEGKSWKDRKGGNDWKEKTERKEWNEEKDWKKAKQSQQLKKEQKKDWKERDGERHKASEERKEDKEGYKESSKEKWDKKQEKEKGGKKEWKTDGEWKNSKDQRKEGKWKSEKVQVQDSRGPRKDGKGWDESKQQKENEWKSRTDGNGRKKDERKQQIHVMSRDGKYEEEWTRDDKQRGRQNRGIKERDGSPFHTDGSKFPGRRGNHDAHLWGQRKHSHRRPSVKQPEYWLNQRTRLQRNPKPPQHCHSVETCAQTEGLPPVTFREFEAVLHTYLARAKEVGVDASAREELQKLANEFFKDGLFVHDQMRFQDFVEDLGDVLEDMVEGEDEDDDEGSAIEEEMEGFQREVMRRFSSATYGGKEERAKGDRRKEGRRGHA